MTFLAPSRRPSNPQPQARLTRWLPELQVLEDRTTPTAYVVNTNADVLAADGFISLREAVQAANTNAAVFDAPAGNADGDTITFASGTNPTLTAGELAITDDVTVSGTVTISGNNASRVFNIDTTAGVGAVKAVTLSSLTLTQGKSAGDGGAVIIADATDVNLNSVTVSNSVAAGSGGGIYAGSGKLTATGGGFAARNLITGNTSNATTAGTGGGGLFLDGTTANLSGFLLEISGNKAVAGTADGGGILNNGGTLTVSGATNSRITGNSAARAGGGIENNGGTVTLTNITLGTFGSSLGNSAGVNGGGLHISGAGNVTIDGGVIKANTAAQEGGGLWNSATGTLTISDKSAGVTISGNTAAGAADPAGDNTKLQGGGGVFNDGGTVSVLDVSANAVAISGNTATGANGSGGGILSIAGDVTVAGTTISGNGASRAGGGIEAVSGNVTLNSVALTGNTLTTAPNPGNGGGLHVTADVITRITNGFVSNNTAAGDGGGLWNSTTGQMIISGTTFQGNRADEGGGVYTNGGALTFDGVTIAGNSAATNGGGVYQVGTMVFGFETVQINNSVINLNTAGGTVAGTGGGGFYAEGSFLLDTTDVTNNTANAGKGDGGGIFGTATSQVSLQGGNVTGNVAGRAGGGVENSGFFFADSTVFDKNTAGVNGGALHQTTGNTVLSFSKVTNNSAVNQGGGLWNSTTGFLSTIFTDITGNVAMTGDGGGVYGDDDGMGGGNSDIELTSGTVSGNTAAVNGGGVAALSGLLFLDTVTVTGNVANGNAPGLGGGGIYTGAMLQAMNATVSNNTATSGTGNGGGILVAPTGTGTFFSGNITGNQAARAGGGIEVNGGTIVLDNNGTIGAGRDALNLANNTAGVNGGGLHTSGAGVVTIRRANVSGNVAQQEGGGLWNSATGTLTVDSTTVTGNVANGNADPMGDNTKLQGGGGIYNDGGTVTLTNDLGKVSVTGNTALGSGGGIFSLAGMVTVTDATISGNEAVRAGGGVEVVSGNLALTNVMLTGNDVSAQGKLATISPGNGGGLHVTGNATTALNSSTVSGNAAGNDGGGLWNSATGQMVVANTTLSNNTAAMSGGGLYNNGGLVAITNGGVTGNTANATTAGSGGGGLFNAGTTTLDGVTVSNNSAVQGKADGGGVLNDMAGALGITGGSVTGNTAARAGGGVENNAGTVNATNATFTGNRAGVNGGALHASGAATNTITLSKVTGNLAGTNGGGLWITSGGKLDLLGATVSGNSANRGGGVYNDGAGGAITVTASTLSGNTATMGGGGLFSSGGSVVFSNATVSGNASGGTGGGVAVTGGTLDLRNATVAFNTASSGGGVSNVGGGVSAVSSIIATNTAGTGKDVAGALTSNGSLLLGSDSGATVTTGSGDLINADPMLAPLADNGGPTLTHDLMAGSRAINTGANPDNLPNDQRGMGFPRVLGPSADIGAYETDSTTPANRAPLGANDTYTATAGQTLTVAGPGLLANDFDADSNPLTVANPGAITLASGQGTLAVNADGSFNYTAPAGFTGNAVFMYSPTDGMATGTAATVTITVAAPVTPPANVAPVGVNDNYTVVAGQTLIVPAAGILTNDTDANGDTLTVANPGAVTLIAGQGTLAVSADGSFTYAAPAGFTGNAVFAYQPTDGTTLGSLATVRIAVTQPVVPPVVPPMVPPMVPPVVPPVVVPPVVPPVVPVAPRAGLNQILVGPGEGGGPIVSLFNSAGASVFSSTVFEAGFSGGVRTALADVNGDGVADLIVGSGPGRRAEVRVFDGTTKAQLFSFLPFEAAFTGGIYVAAGDINNDGFADVVISPDQGGGPRVVVVSGKDQSRLADFFGIEDTAFRGGARVAVGDLNNDSQLDLLVAAGFGGGPRVAGFDGAQLGTGSPRKLFADFFAFEPALRDGVFLASGDLNGDRFSDVIAGSGPGGGPRVLALSGKGLTSNNSAVQLANFFAGDPNQRSGVRVAAKDLDGDGLADIVIGSGIGAGSKVVSYPGSQLTSNGLPPIGLSFDAFPAFTGGVYVG